MEGLLEWKQKLVFCKGVFLGRENITSLTRELMLHPGLTGGKDGSIFLLDRKPSHASHLQPSSACLLYFLFFLLVMKTNKKNKGPLPPPLCVQ